MRRLHLGRHTRQARVLVAPVELVGLAGIEAQRHKTLRRRQQPPPPTPGPGVAAHCVVAAAIAQSRKVFMNPQQRQPIPARPLLVGLQLALELIHPRPKLRHRLDLALVAVRGLIAPHHLAHRVLRNPQIPGDLLDRNAPHQMIPTYPCDRLHNQHLPRPRLSKQRGVLKITKPGGSILDADYPTKGINIPRRSTAGQRLQLFGLFLDGVMIAGIIAFVNRSCFSLLVTAYDPNGPSSCSPGIILLVKTLELSSRAGLETYDLLIGDEAYKFDWSNRTIDPPSPSVV